MGEGQCCRLTEIGTVELSASPAIGFPVPPSALIARSFFAGGERAVATLKGEGAGRLQPVIPLGRLHKEPMRLPTVLIEQGSITYTGCCVCHTKSLSSRRRTLRQLYDCSSLL